ncbi:MFS transporter [Pseudarthrobacter psychrotolerans]|uniref:MFS transporter n=1 Tax=Pseudarthrobacter psychrotolerans TaxID=2697569 RepID=A0A6P1NLZ7_9MICC|nr:MFS transporter [Pseudarthrobacter psychrotolerans]QHK18572.1 MFS transporter [Pseudarthrobacter psychrotolerans]
MSTKDIDRKVLRKVALRLLPMLMILYFLSYLDRVNVGFAALTMNADLGFSATAYGLGAGLFFIGYFLFEVPSNLLLAKFGARIWITRIILTWGAIAGMMAFVQGPISFYILRFLLGAAEAGFFPGIIYFLGLWFPRSERGRIVAFIYAAAPVSFLLGSPLSTLLIQYGHGFMGLAGWRFMFAIEGLATVAAGIVAYFILVDRPTKAKWLPTADAKRLEGLIAAEDAAVKATHSSHSLRKAFSPRVFLLGLIYFGISYGAYAIGFFLPQIVSGFQATYGVKFNLTQIGLITAIPFAIATAVMLPWARHSDKKQERFVHLAITTFLGGAAIAVSLLLGSPVLSMVGITFTAVGIYCSIPVFWQLPPTFLTGTAAAAGLGVINSLGNLSGFFAPYLSGYFKDMTGSLQPGMLVASGFTLLSGVLVLVLRTQINKNHKAEAAVQSQGSLVK